MRPVLVAVIALAIVLTFAAVAAGGCAGGFQAAPAEVHGSLPAWALFSFAVSAFREPLR